ncbi:hypothetical protein D0Y65_003016 [Glycine soja]|uniref:Uncharacterized protein n=1 Tax=Glycine soja TaxID=3848 RepID=A0A445LJR2_GLYSO|nr:hypothetical protein D0Y65_003016 [Glycine soja]
MVAAVGAGLTGSKMTRRVGGVDEFEFKAIGENHNQGFTHERISWNPTCRYSWDFENGQPLQRLAEERKQRNRTPPLKVTVSVCKKCSYIQDSMYPIEVGLRSFV